MLPPWIIEQIRQREEESRRGDDRPALMLPLDDSFPPLMPEPHQDEDENTGVVIIDMCGPRRS